MTNVQQQTDAREFADFWKGKGYEKGQSQPFWFSLLRTLGVPRPETFIEFEDKAHIDSAHGFIDGYIPATHVLIEQKSLGKSLRSGIPQSDGSVLTPFQQAKRYSVDLPYSCRPRWVVTCNFAEFLIYDMEKPNAEPESLLLENLPDELYRLKFLTDTGADFIRREEEISRRAGDVVGLIYDALLAQYRDPTNPESLKSLNELCVRLVFLLYAEDSDVFEHLQFHDYLAQFSAARARDALIALFRVLDTPPDKRDPYLAPDLAAFPYVNGGLFANENLEIPQFTDELLDLILRKGSEDFDWQGISPTIFGAVFESTLNPETRRSGGMHYTSVANIHKVIDPLFLDSLTERVGAAMPPAGTPCTRQMRQRLLDLQAEIASLTFLDPACGSGNFLTETFISLRRLENKLLEAMYGGQGVLDFSGDLVKVALSHFHGIEINDFAVKVAKTALWIAESQMLRETARIAHRNLDFLPLKPYDGIVEGNALRLDWPHTNFIIGNPPFVGYSLQSSEQKNDICSLYRDERGRPYAFAGKIDYVAGWYWKSAELMAANPATRTALVSTNSITQGEQVASVWRPLMERFGVQIDFAHRTFRWDSESNSMAHVHCVIVGFSCGGTTTDSKPLYDGERVAFVPHINAYLLPAPDIWIESRRTPLCDVPEMNKGSQPTDGGNLILGETEKTRLLQEYPQMAQLVHQFLGSEEFINGKTRWCLWLKGVSPAVLRSCPPVMKRLEAVREMRLASPKAATRKWAVKPMLFTEDRQPESGNYLLVPSVSSENRRYIPIGFVSHDVIASNLVLLVPSATLYHFGVLTSKVHMAWMRAVAGRLKSDYRYSAAIVYNNFPWPSPTAAQQAQIEMTAQSILDARANHPDSTLADLYDELTMQPDLRNAHRDNDRAVMAAYGFPPKMTESECVSELFRLYKALLG